MTARDDTEPTASVFDIEDSNVTRPYPPSGTTRATTSASVSTPPGALTVNERERAEAERLLRRMAPAPAHHPSGPRAGAHSDGEPFAVHYAAPVAPPPSQRIIDPSASVHVSDTTSDTSPPRFTSVTNPQFTALPFGGPPSSAMSNTTPGTQPITQPMTLTTRVGSAAHAARVDDALRRVLHAPEPPEPLGGFREQSTGLPEAARTRRRWVAIPLLVLTALLLVLLVSRRSEEPPKLVTTTSATRLWPSRTPRSEVPGQDIPPPPLELPVTTSKAVPPSTASVNDSRAPAPPPSPGPTRHPSTGGTKHDIAESYEYE